LNEERILSASEFLKGLKIMGNGLNQQKHEHEHLAQKSTLLDDALNLIDLW